jgi:hypothetical protein
LLRRGHANLRTGLTDLAGTREILLGAFQLLQLDFHELRGELLDLAGALQVLLGAPQALRRGFPYLGRGLQVLVRALEFLLGTGQLLQGADQDLGGRGAVLDRVLQHLRSVPQLLHRALQFLRGVLQVLRGALQYLLGALQVVGAGDVLVGVLAVGVGRGGGDRAVVDRPRADREVLAVAVGFGDVAILVVHRRGMGQLETADAAHRAVPVAVRGEDGEVLLAGVLDRVGRGAGDHAAVGTVVLAAVIAPDAREAFAQRRLAVGALGIEDVEPARGLVDGEVGVVEVADFEELRIVDRRGIVGIDRGLLGAVVELLRRDGDEAGAVFLLGGQRQESTPDGRLGHLHAVAIVGIPVGEALTLVRVGDRPRRGADVHPLPDQPGRGAGAGGTAGRVGRRCGGDQRVGAAVGGRVVRGADTGGGREAAIAERAQGADRSVGVDPRGGRGNQAPVVSGDAR